LCSDPERAAFRALLDAGLADSFRLFEQPEKTFSWWDYRQLAFPKNNGLRIDHILLSPALASRCAASRIDRAARKGEKPSDHAPVLVELRDA
jgi:exodeoxyribonuclease-3